MLGDNDTEYMHLPADYFKEMPRGSKDNSVMVRRF